jgi:hypothetical protein
LVAALIALIFAPPERWRFFMSFFQTKNFSGGVHAAVDGSIIKAIYYHTMERSPEL